MKKRFLRELTDCFSRNLVAVLLFFAVALLNGAVFWLYEIVFEPFFYALILSFFALLVFLTVDFFSHYRKSQKRERVRSAILSEWKNLPKADTLEEEDYREMIGLLGEQAERLTVQFTKSTQEMSDYYTAWVHQIKTPIAVMRLKLNPETDPDGVLSDQLFRIEQYVEMVLSYVRLDSPTNDFVVREYELDDLIREVLRKYAPQFVLRKLKLNYEPTGVKTVTDRKWFTAILEQLISNAIKYTPSGSITVTATERSLTVSDTGVGIPPEDLPRIFERGYTGANGRLGEKSSGLGLYLAVKAAKKLSLKLSCDSRVGVGSSFSISW